MNVEGLQMSAVAKRLGVDSSTVRRWSRQFAARLSVAAQVDTQEGRRYSDEDVAILIRVKQPTLEGKTIEAVKETLKYSYCSAAQPLTDETTKRVKQSSDPTFVEDAVSPTIQLRWCA